MQGKATQNESAGGESGQVSPRQRLGVDDQEFQAMGEIGAMYYRHGNLDKARTIFEGLVELDPSSAAAHSALGALLTRTEEFEQALKHLDRAVELDPEEIVPYVNRAEIFIRQGRAEEAVTNVKMGVELDPYEKDPAANRARAMALGIAQALKSHGVAGGQSSNARRGD